MTRIKSAYTTDTKPERPMNFRDWRRRHAARLSLVGGLTACAVIGCEKPAAAPAAPPPAAVNVAKPVVKQIVEWDEYTGRLGPVEAVDIRARVSGYLESIHFTDGQIIAKGDLLFVIDPRPFQAAFNAADAETKQAETRLDLAKNDLKRVEGLAHTRAISQEDLDTRSKAVDGAAATVAAAKARAEQARLDLEFTEIRAPMAGRIARHTVSTGNFVNGGTTDSTVLTNIVAVSPIYCYFDIDEQSYLKYLRLDKSGQLKSSRGNATPVQVALLDETTFTHDGKMNFLDNQIDTSTGTLRGRAVLDNTSLDLLPGVFVKVRLPGSGNHRGVMLPDRAIQADQSDRFVFVVDDKNVVTQRKVVPGRMYGGLRLISSGLEGNESVIVDGVQRVRPGAPVTPEDHPIPIDLAGAPPALEGIAAADRVPTTQLS
ncbi:MAG: hypothetical protein JWM57_1932, partial [Phycisphaerales bacterium]|nr:hypothetical protein [Phycisphaerales bacterium]